MLKFLPWALVPALLCLIPGQSIQPGVAGTCASNCLGRIQFTPGQRVTVAVVNQTSGLVLLEQVEGSDPVPVQPGQELRFPWWGGTKPNISMVFWDQTSLPLRAEVTQPNRQTLRVQLRPNYAPPGDRAIYILNDGRVTIY